MEGRGDFVQQVIYIDGDIVYVHTMKHLIDICAIICAIVYAQDKKIFQSVWGLAVFCS